MKIRLVRPTEQLKEQAIKFRQEFFDNHEMVINGSELFDKTDQYEDWLKAVTANTNIETVNVNWVVTDTFFAVDEKDKIVGIIDLRHTLNDFLKDLGNCGYSVRPSERKKGYATEMLQLLLPIAKNAGMKELYLSVERDNEASIKTIVKNGGKHERSWEFCRKAGLLSPVYAFTDRGGCWFCPNAKLSELRHLYDHHPDLWARMMALQAIPGKTTEKFNRTQKFSDIDAMFRQEDEAAAQAAA